MTETEGRGGGREREREREKNKVIPMQAGPLWIDGGWMGTDGLLGTFLLLLLSCFFSVGFLLVFLLRLKGVSLPRLFCV